jgi:hypothetical protein
MKEEEIRPKKIFDEYLRLAAQDTYTYFNQAERRKIACPGCSNPGAVAFEKSGFVYEQCSKCQTLYVSPRPVAEAFSQYYLESPSSQYWATTFYKETAEARREKLWRPKAREIQKILSKFYSKPSDHPILTPLVETDANCELLQDVLVVDIGGGYGLFAEEIRKLLPREPIVIEPAPHLAQVCRGKGLQVVEKFLEDICVDDLPKSPKVFVSFELFEHLHDPMSFMSNLYSLMQSGDLFIFTTLSGNGLDIQILWENSKSIMPPHHLNFFNPQSVRMLLERTGFKPLQVTTPGKLDIDILSNNQSLIKDRFWNSFLSLTTDAEKQAWQSWIADQGWSSHMWVVCCKP